MDTPPAPSEPSLSAALRQATRRALEALARFGKPHVVIGAVALTGYGEPRATKDVDFMVFCAPSDWARFDSIARTFGLNLDHEWNKRNPLLRGLAVRYRFHEIPIDFLLPRNRYEAGLKRRRVMARVAAKKCAMLRPEDFILLKAKAGRGKDFGDAIRVAYRCQEDMNYRYLRSWSIKLGVFEEIQYIVATAEQGGE